MNQTSDTTPSEAPAATSANGQPPADIATANEPSGFGSRGRIRRRARFLRKARELAYRDLGGLVFNLHRFGQRNDPLVLAKLTTVAQIDTELRTLEAALGRREPVTVLREAGINACPRCAAIHSSEDRFCPNCGLPMARHVDLPIAGAPAAANPGAATPAPTLAPSQPTEVPPTPATAPASTEHLPSSSPSPPPAEAAPSAPQAPASTATPVAAPSPGRSPTPPGSGLDGNLARSSANTSGLPPEEPTEILKPQPPQS